MFWNEYQDIGHIFGGDPHVLWKLGSIKYGLPQSYGAKTDS